jgi:hypothetical protein
VVLFDSGDSKGPLAPFSRQRLAYGAFGFVRAQPKERAPTAWLSLVFTSPTRIWSGADVRWDGWSEPSGSLLQPAHLVQNATDGTNTLPTTTGVIDEVTTTASAIGPTTSTFLGPITGYGDFSGMSWFEIDERYVAELVVRCMKDAGMPATLSPDGGVLFEDIPLDQNRQAQATMQACIDGLNLPVYTPPTERDRPDLSVQPGGEGMSRSPGLPNI